jgi:hypothetical protein
VSARRRCCRPRRREQLVQSCRVELENTARAEVVHTFGDILTSKDPAVTQKLKNVGQQVPVIAMAAQVVHNALRRGQRHHADANRPGAGNGLQRTASIQARTVGADTPST